MHQTMMGWGLLMGDVQFGGGACVHTLPNLFLKMLTEGAVPTVAGSLYQYFRTLIKKAHPSLRRRLVP